MYFLNIYFLAGNFQKPIEEESQYSLDFLTLLCMYKKNTLPLGLANAPETF